MIEWRASLVPEASVMPARLMYGKFIAVVTFVVSYCWCLFIKRSTVRKWGCLKGVPVSMGWT